MTRATLVSLALLIATTGHAADPLPATFRLPPLRPTMADVSYAVRDTGVPFKWCPIRTPAGGTFSHYEAASQTCMDALAETSLVAMVQLARVLRYVPKGDKVTEFCLSESQGASAITAFLNPIYEGNFGEYRGDWAEDWSGKDYGKPAYCAKKARSFLLSNPKACAAVPELVPLLPFLNLAIRDGQCVNDYREPIFPETKIDKRVKDLGTIDYDTRQPPLTGAQLHLLHVTHAQHQAVSDWRCGVGEAPAAGVVQDAHLALERSARTEVEHHFFVLKAFSGAVDPRYAKAEECQWARLQDHDHARWMQAVEAGDWAASRKAESDHQASHFCMNLRDERLKIRRTDCGQANISKCPVETCAQILARYPGR